jgi:hypothetical protein
MRRKARDSPERIQRKKVGVARDNRRRRVCGTALAPHNDFDFVFFLAWPIFCRWREQCSQSFTLTQ